MKLNEKAYVNKMAFIGHAIISIIIFLAYVLEWVKGSRTIVYTLIMTVLTLAPVAADVIIYRKNPESAILKHVMAITYGILYAFVIFTTNSLLPFTYVYPMFMMIILYSDMRFCLLIGTVAFLENVASVAYIALTVGYAKEQIPDVEIRVLLSIVLAVYAGMSTKVINQVNTAKMKDINDQKDQTGRLLDKVMTTSTNMIGGIEDISAKMQQMGEAVEHIHDSMKEVSTGSTETADSIQEQLRQTETIQEHIRNVKDTVDAIEKNMAEASGLVDEGGRNMDALADQVDKSRKANDMVLQQMSELKEYTSQMNTIIETITSIANSTGMLALNASIEAARAGEAGRGFAVVAGEISSLANQTKAATVNITELISNINDELEDVSNAVEVVTESNQQNTENTRIVKENFLGIADETANIGKQTDRLAEVVIALEQANNEIVEKIETISAITEEVSAHANETFESCEENRELVAQANVIVKQLSDGAETLKSDTGADAETDADPDAE